MAKFSDNIGAWLLGQLGVNKQYQGKLINESVKYGHYLLLVAIKIVVDSGTGRFLFLRPENDDLKAYYMKFGFTESCIEIEQLSSKCYADSYDCKDLKLFLKKT